MLKRKLSPQTLAVIKYMVDRPKADYYGLELIEATGMPLIVKTKVVVVVATTYLVLQVKKMVKSILQTVSKNLAV